MSLTATQRRGVVRHLGNAFTNDKLAERFMNQVDRDIGNVWYVDSGSGASTNDGQSPDTPFATLAQAISAATANNGDTIVLMPGHAETISGAAGVDNTKAGIAVVGIGWGSDRPTFTLTAAASTFAVGANNLYFENLLFVANFTNGVTAGIDIDGSHADITFKNCEWRATSATKEFLKAVTIAEGATRVTFDGCRFFEDAGTASAAIFCESSMTDLRLYDCTIIGDYSAACVDADDDTISGRVEVVRCLMHNLDTTAGLCVTIAATTIGLFIDSRFAANKSNTVPVSDTTLSFGIGSLGTDQDNTYAIEVPATATAWT